VLCCSALSLSPHITLKFIDLSPSFTVSVRPHPTTPATSHVAATALRSSQSELHVLPYTARRPTPPKQPTHPRSYEEARTKASYPRIISTQPPTIRSQVGCPARGQSHPRQAANEQERHFGSLSRGERYTIIVFACLGSISVNNQSIASRVSTSLVQRKCLRTYCVSWRVGISAAIHRASSSRARSWLGTVNPQRS
jgi:hypothetical protein